MLSADEDALACDLAEQFHVLDMRQLPVKTLANLACGLRKPARIHKAMGWSSISQEYALQLLTVDTLRLIAWLHSEDARHGRNRPESLLAKELQATAEPETEVFDSPEAFEAARADIIEKTREQGRRENG